MNVKPEVCSRTTKRPHLSAGAVHWASLEELTFFASTRKDLENKANPEENKDD